MASQEAAEPRLDEQAQPPIRLPRLGVIAAGAVSFLLSASLIVVSPIGLFVAPLALVPIVQWVVVDARRGVLAWGWVTALLGLCSAAGVTVLGASAWVYLAVYLLVVALPAASLEAWRALGWTEGRWVALTTLAGAVGTLAATFVAARPLPPLEALSEWFHRTREFVEESYRGVGVATGELELAFDTVGAVVPWIAPSVVVAYLVAVLFWLRPRLPILGFPMPVEPFELYRGDDWLAAGFAVGGLGTVFLEGTPRWLAVNLLIGVLVLFFVQGLAMIRAHLVRWVGRGWMVRWGVALLCLQGPLPLVVAALGIADGFFRLRPRIGDDGGTQ